MSYNFPTYKGYCPNYEQWVEAHNRRISTFHQQLFSKPQPAKRMPIRFVMPTHPEVERIKEEMSARLSRWRREDEMSRQRKVLAVQQRTNVARQKESQSLTRSLKLMEPDLMKFNVKEVSNSDIDPASIVQSTISPRPSRREASRIRKMDELQMRQLLREQEDDRRESARREFAIRQETLHQEEAARRKMLIQLQSNYERACMEESFASSDEQEDEPTVSAINFIPSIESTNVDVCVTSSTTLPANSSDTHRPVSNSLPNALTEPVDALKTNNYEDDVCSDSLRVIDVSSKNSSLNSDCNQTDVDDQTDVMKTTRKCMIGSVQALHANNMTRIDNRLSNENCGIPNNKSGTFRRFSQKRTPPLHGIFNKLNEFIALRIHNVTIYSLAIISLNRQYRNNHPRMLSITTASWRRWDPGGKYSLFTWADYTTKLTKLYTLYWKTEKRTCVKS